METTGVSRRSFVAGIRAVSVGTSLGVLMQAKEELRAPTFTKDVAPILQSKCQACHSSFAPHWLEALLDASSAVATEAYAQIVHRAAVVSQLRLVNALIALVLRRFGNACDHRDDIYSIEIPFFLVHGSHPPANRGLLARPAIP